VIKSALCCRVQEELANVNMAKYRKLQQEMEGAVERADMAENTLGQLRARNRSASVAPESTTTFGLTVNHYIYRATHVHSAVYATFI